MGTKNVGGNKDLGGQRIVNLGDASSATDAVTLQQVQAYLRGLDWKASVRAATTGNGTLATAYANGQTLDGVTLATGDRILLKDQTTGADNGIYVVASSGAPARASDADSDAEVTSGLAVTVTEGTTNGDKTFVLTTNDPLTVGTTALAFTQLGGGGNTYTAGDGLDLTGSDFSLDLKSGGGLAIDAGELKIDTAYTGLAKRYSINVPTNSSAVITHSLGTTDVIVQVHEISGGALVEPDVVITDSNTVTLGFASTPSSGQYRCTVLG